MRLEWGDRETDCRGAVVVRFAVAGRLAQSAWSEGGTVECIGGGVILVCEC